MTVKVAIFATWVMILCNQHWLLSLIFDISAPEVAERAILIMEKCILGVNTFNYREAVWLIEQADAHDKPIAPLESNESNSNRPFSFKGTHLLLL